MFTYDHELGYFLHEHKYVFSFTHELTFRYFIYEHKHFLENSLYIHTRKLKDIKHAHQHLS